MLEVLRMSQDRHREERYRNRKLRGNQFLCQQCGKRLRGMEVRQVDTSLFGYKRALPRAVRQKRGAES